MKDLRHSPSRTSQKTQQQSKKQSRKFQVLPKPDAQPKDATKTIRADQRTHSLNSKYRPRLLTAQGARPEDQSGVNDTSHYGNLRLSSNGWMSTKDGFSSNPLTALNIEKLKQKERQQNLSQGKDVKVTNHILDGEEFLRLLKETKQKKEYFTEDLNRGRLTQLVQQNYWKRLQQTNRFL